MQGKRRSDNVKIEKKTRGRVKDKERIDEERIRIKILDAVQGISGKKDV